VTQDHVNEAPRRRDSRLEVATGELRARFASAVRHNQFPTFSPDGTLLAVEKVERDREKAFLLLVETGSFKIRKSWRLPALPRAYQSAIHPACAFNRTGKVLATTANGMVVLWDVETGEELDRLTDGRRLAPQRRLQPTADVLAVENAFRVWYRGGRWGLDSACCSWTSIRSRQPTKKACWVGRPRTTATRTRWRSPRTGLG